MPSCFVACPCVLVSGIMSACDGCELDLLMNEVTGAASAESSLRHYTSSPGSLSCVSDTAGAPHEILHKAVFMQLLQETL